MFYQSSRPRKTKEVNDFLQLIKLEKQKEIQWDDWLNDIVFFAAPLLIVGYLLPPTSRVFLLLFIENMTPSNILL